MAAFSGESSFVTVVKFFNMIGLYINLDPVRNKDKN